MKNLSVVQACRIWTDLCQAYYNDHHYGGDVAELYAYRFMPYLPSAHTYPLGSEIQKRATQEVERQAADSLYELLRLFALEMHCAIKVDGRPLGVWVSDMPFGHRVHVKVTPRRRR